MTRWSLKNVLDTIVSIALLCAATVVIWNGTKARVSPNRTDPNTPSVPAQPVTIEGAPQRGALESRAGLLIFSDFECPYCARFANEVLPTVEREYVDTGKLLLVFRSFPLSMHPLAVPASLAALCASDQGRFWQAHDALFQGGTPVTRDKIAMLADNLQLRKQAFRACDERQSDVRVSRDEALGHSLGVHGTPTFFIGKVEGASLHVTNVVSGFVEVDRLRSMLDPLSR